MREELRNFAQLSDREQNALQQWWECLSPEEAAEAFDNRTPEDRAHVLDEAMRRVPPLVSPRYERNRATDGSDQGEQGCDSEKPQGQPDATPPPPRLATERRILSRFAQAAARCGLVGERANAQLVYLALTSRLLDKPVSLTVKGHSSSGKSYTVKMVRRFFPDDSAVEFTAMSEKALIYSSRSFEHKTIILYEATALKENIQDDQTSYFVRTLLSEGRLSYEVTVKDPKTGNFTTKFIDKDGPTNLILTTTKTRIHDENETRAFSLNSDDSPAQTARILRASAAQAGDYDLSEWVALQTWLEREDAEHRVVIPYAAKLAAAIPPVAVRLRRDFAALLSLIETHAVLHQATRETDDQGRIVATLEDYMMVRRLIVPIISEGVGKQVSETVRETVEAVTDLLTSNPDGVMAVQVAQSLRVDKSTATRRIASGASGGYLVNEETRKGHPGRWKPGDALPGNESILPRVAAVADGRGGTATVNPQVDGAGCTVAPKSEGRKEGDDVYEVLPNGVVITTDPTRLGVGS
jgi:hypothetical protein